VLSHIPKIFEQFNLKTPKNIRNIFYSGNKDWHFAEVDVAGADLAIAAFLSKDPLYIEDILKGGFHTTKMRDYFKDKTLTKDNASKYVTSKSITFRVAYTAGLMSAALPIQAEIYAESGELVDIEIIKYALGTWKNYETYMKYREKCQASVEHEMCIKNARGMKFLFEETSNPAIKAGWMNQALAYPIASELALVMWDISVQMKKRLEKDKIWMKWCYPVDVVHDANYWIIHKGIMKDNYFPEVCKHYFTDEVKIATGDNLGMEIVVADRWKGKEKVFAKETKWCFKDHIWKWEDDPTVISFGS
jgi:DNA polymerase I-like protein with 3'-5' exonuclease and polymerase domains